MKQQKHIIVLICLSYLFLVSCTKHNNKVQVEGTLSSVQEEVKEAEEEQESPAQTYDELKSEIKNEQNKFSKTYSRANKQGKDSIILLAQQYVLNKCDDMFKAWYATPWTFEGHTKTPREGSIACGYFVTTTLQDMGFKIPRYYWAQQGADYMTYKLSKDVKRFHLVPMSDIVDYIKEKGEGLYLVGLDCHVGYIYYHNKKMNFVHSNYYKKSIGVMSEPLIGRNPLNDSKLKVIGKIMDNEMIVNWVSGKNYEK